MGVSAVAALSVLPRNDGVVVCCGVIGSGNGNGTKGPCVLPTLDDGVRFVNIAAHTPISLAGAVLQLTVHMDGASHLHINCSSMAGNELCRVIVDPSISIRKLRKQIADELGYRFSDAVLPNGYLLS